jgi:hypothetical protein
VRPPKPRMQRPPAREIVSVRHKRTTTSRGSSGSPLVAVEHIRARLKRRTGLLLNDESDRLEWWWSSRPTPPKTVGLV